MVEKTKRRLVPLPTKQNISIKYVLTFIDILFHSQHRQRRIAPAKRLPAPPRIYSPLGVSACLVRRMTPCVEYETIPTLVMAEMTRRRLAPVDPKHNMTRHTIDFVIHLLTHRTSMLRCASHWGCLMHKRKNSCEHRIERNGCSQTKFHIGDALYTNEVLNCCEHRTTSKSQENDSDALKVRFCR